MAVLHLWRHVVRLAVADGAEHGDPVQQLADGLVRLSKIGLDGTLLNRPRYIEDRRWFRDRVYPLVVQAGLR